MRKITKSRVARKASGKGRQRLARLWKAAHIAPLRVTITARSIATTADERSRGTDGEIRDKETVSSRHGATTPRRVGARRQQHLRTAAARVKQRRSLKAACSRITRNSLGGGGGGGGGGGDDGGSPPPARYSRSRVALASCLEGGDGCTSPPRPPPRRRPSGATTIPC